MELAAADGAVLVGVELAHEVADVSVQVVHVLACHVATLRVWLDSQRYAHVLGDAPSRKAYLSR